MLKPWLRIVRLPLAATPVCDVLACTLLGWMSAGRAFDVAQLGSWGLLAATSLLIYFAGMAANDLADEAIPKPHPIHGNRAQKIIQSLLATPNKGPASGLVTEL